MAPGTLLAAPGSHPAAPETLPGAKGRRGLAPMTKSPIPDWVRRSAGTAAILAAMGRLDLLPESRADLLRAESIATGAKKTPPRPSPASRERAPPPAQGKDLAGTYESRIQGRELEAWNDHFAS